MSCPGALVGCRRPCIQDVVGAGTRTGRDVIDVRNAFTSYFVDISPVEWQDKHVNRGTFTE